MDTVSHPTKQWLAIQDRTGRVLVWDTDTGEQRFTGRGGSWDFPRSVAWSPDGKYLASGSGQKWYSGSQGCADIWEIASGEKIGSLGNNRCRARLAWSPDSRWLAIGSFDDRKLQVWDVTRKTIVASIDDLGTVMHRLSVSRDGRLLAAATHAGPIALIEASTGRHVADLDAHSIPVRVVEWSPDGRRIVTSARDGTLRIWDAATAQELLVIGPETPVGLNARWSRDGRRIGTFSPDGVVRIWGTPQLELPRNSEFLDEGVLAGADIVRVRRQEVRNPNPILEDSEERLNPSKTQ